MFHDTVTSLSSIISGIYAPTQQRENDSFWNMLNALIEIFDLPWCIIWDFNELANPSEKRGGIIYPSTKFQRLNNFLLRNSVISVPVNGLGLTWKKRIPTHLIYERLDRAILQRKNLPFDFRITGAGTNNSIKSSSHSGTPGCRELECLNLCQNLNMLKYI